MNSQIAIKPSLNVSITNKTKTNIKVSNVQDKEYTTCKFRNSTDLGSVFKQNKYVDYVIPSGFNNISKIDQVVVDIECEVSKLVQTTTPVLQSLFATYILGGVNGLTSVSPGPTTNSITFPIGATNSDDSTVFIYSASNVGNSGYIIGGTYNVNNITTSCTNPAVNPVIRVEIGYKNSVSGLITKLAQSDTQNILAGATNHNFVVNVPTTYIPNPSIDQLVLFVELKNTLTNASPNTITLNYGPATALTRNVYNYDFSKIQNLPVWCIFDRVQLLINGKVADEISSQNYFCELALQSRESLKQYAKTMLMDPDNYGLLYNYPGAISFVNDTPVPVVKTDTFRYQLPLFSTFLSSENYITDLVKDQISVRVFFRPYDTFKLSSPGNCADSMRLVSSSLYLTGSKFVDDDLRHVKNKKGSKPHTCMILLRKYGNDKLIRVKQADNLTYAPLYGQALYDLSFMNGRFLCLFTMVYPENVIGGENFLQLGLIPTQTATASIYESEPVTTTVNPNTYPIKVSVQPSINNVLGKEYLYTPDSAFRLDRVSLINDLGHPIYQNLQYADFLRNVMSTTGINNDFLKTYAIYPMYFTNQIDEDYKNQHSGSGFLSMSNIYNIEIILSNPESSSLPFYEQNNSANPIINTLQNSLWTCGLQIAEMHIMPNGKLQIITN